MALVYTTKGPLDRSLLSCCFNVTETETSHDLAVEWRLRANLDAIPDVLDTDGNVVTPGRPAGVQDELVRRDVHISGLMPLGSTAAPGAL